MNFLRRLSILQLILVSFVLVMAPLIVALVTAAVQVDRLSTHAKRSVLDAVTATQSSRILVEHVIAMERSARQFQVLRDRTLLEAYADRHRQFQQRASNLQQLSVAPRAALAELARDERRLHEILDDPDAPADAVAEAIEGFPAIHSAARAILAESSNLVGENVAQLERLARRAQNLLFWQTMSLVPLALALLMLFTTLIIKPMRRLHQAIRHLGDGRFEREILIKGPNDLRELGERLEWMRRRILTLENQKLMFLRHMSHELKTPLTTIREGSELLGDQVVGSLNDEQAEIAALLRQNSLRLQKLIEDLLSFSILERDVLRVRREPVTLDKVMRDVLSGYRLPARAKRVSIDARLESVTVSGDRDKLRSVVDNLVSNAVKYSPAKGEIIVALARQGDRAIIEVVDQGPGIDQDDRGRIFHAFYQGRARASGPVKGTGLGLSITREFVHLHHGTIEVIETGSGAHFRVSLPCNPDPSPPDAIDFAPSEEMA